MKQNKMEWNRMKQNETECTKNFTLPTRLVTEEPLEDARNQDKKT